MKTRIAQVKEFNIQMAAMSNYTMMMTLDNGSMADKPRSKGWVIYQSPRLGDDHDFAKWYPNRKEAELNRSTMQ